MQFSQPVIAYLATIKILLTNSALFAIKLVSHAVLLEILNAIVVTQPY